MVPGDVGYKPEDVERNLEELFRLAHRWGCILLLDEADVFLSKRSVSSFIARVGRSERALTLNSEMI